MYKNLAKPLIDFILALIILLLLSPVFIFVTIMLTITNKGEPFFFQRRPGKNDKIFKIIKFKTMNDDKDKNGNLLPDDERMSRVGKIVRETSLDEIPQLFNVLKGEMSIIGPRPLMPEYLPLYNEEQKKRHLVKPGITGWAQVNGRNTISWDDKFKYDVWYVNNLSLRLDLKIILLTFKKIIKTNEISAEGHPTMPRFDELHKDKS